jgi:putative flippase GtrA
MIIMVKDLYIRLDERYPTYVRIGRFLLSGGIAFGTDLVLLYFFTDVLGIWYLSSAVAAFVLAFGVSFTLQKYWTFGDHSREGMHMQMGVYFLVAVANLALNTLLVYVFVEWASLHYLLAQMLASALIAIESFFVYQRFIFKNTI